MAELFKADIFSKPIPVFTRASLAAETTVRAIGAALFPRHLVEIVAIDQFGGNEINSNNYRVRTSGATYLLKRLPSTADAAILGRQLGLMHWLAEMDAPVAHAVESATGELLATHSEALWCLLDFVEGNFFSGAPAEVGSAAIELGRLQRTLHATPDALKPPVKWVYATESDHEVLQAVAGRVDQFDAIFGAQAGGALTAAWERVASAGRELEQRQDEVLHAPRAACHCDIHPHNLLVHDGRLRAFIDFESFATMPTEAALGYGTYKLIRQYAVHESLGSGNTDAVRTSARRFMQAMADQGDQIPFNHDRLRLMAVSELFRRILVVFRLNVRDGNQAWNHVLPMHLAGLAEIDIIFGR